MSKHVDSDAVTRKTIATEHSDGLMELAIAALLLVFALLITMVPALLPIFVAPIVLVAPGLVMRAKERITYARIGYVRLPKQARGRLALGMLAFVAGAVVISMAVIAISGDLGDAAQWRKWAPLLAGLLTSGGFLYAAGRSGLTRYNAVAGFSIGAGVVISIIAAGEDYRPVSAYLLVMAVALAVLGAVTLVAFVRRNPVVDDMRADHDPV
jgi:hypothetical protein